MIVSPAPSDPAAVRRILEALPDWFGDRASLEELRDGLSPIAPWPCLVLVKPLDAQPVEPPAT